MSQEALVEKAIAEVNGRFPDWKPTAPMLGYARAVCKAALSPAGEVGELVDRLRSHAIDQRGVAEGIRNGDEITIRDGIGTADNWAKAAEDFERAAVLIASLTRPQDELVKALERNATALNAFIECVGKKWSDDVYLWHRNATFQEVQEAMEANNQARALVEKHKGEGE